MKKHIDSLLKSRGMFTKPNPVIIFEERVKLKCFHCSRYSQNWMCPPNIPDLNYLRILNEYDNGLLVWHKMEDRKESSIILHKALLEAEKLLWDNNYPLAISFIGGSCKLCDTGCDRDRCSQPELARIPLEAIGVNVIKTSGLPIVFPPKEIYRVGLLAW